MSQINNTNDENVNIDGQEPTINTNNEVNTQDNNQEETNEESQENNTENEELSEEEGEVDNFEKGLRNRTFENEEVHKGLDALDGVELARNEEEDIEELFSYLEDNVQDSNPEIKSYDYTLIEDNPNDTLQGNVLEGSEKGDGEHVFTWLVTDAIYGSLQFDNEGNFTYVLDNSLDSVQALSEGEEVAEEFFYSYTDSDGDVSIASLVINITGTNDAPIVEQAIADVIEDTSPSISGQLKAKDIDNNDEISFSVDNSTGKYGSIVVNADGTYTYTLNNDSPLVQSLGEGESVEEIFEFSVTDDKGATSTSSITITITGTNDAPTITNTSATINEHASKIEGTLPQAEDVDSNDNHTYSVEDGKGLYGTLIVNADGTYSYVLDDNSPAKSLALGDSLEEKFTYEVSDGKGGTATNEIIITIQGQNDAPQAENLYVDVFEDLTTELNGYLPEATDSDNGSVVTYIAQDESSEYGQFILNTDGSYQFILNNNNQDIQALSVGDEIRDRFYYYVTDEHGATSKAFIDITINGTNDAPIASTAKNSVFEDKFEEVQGYLPTIQDIDKNDTTSYIAKTVVTEYGTLVLKEDGSYTYTLDPVYGQAMSAGAIVIDVIQYEVIDSEGAISKGNIEISITGNNDNPIIEDMTIQLQEDVLTQISGNLPEPSDVDFQDELSFIAKSDEQGLYGTFTVNADGTYSYILDNDNPIIQALAQGETITDKFIYTVVDKNGGVAQGYLDVVIAGQNDAPIAMKAYTTVVEDTKTTSYGDLQNSVTDVDNDESFTFEATEIIGKYGTFKLNTDGTYTYTLNNSLDVVQGLTEGEKLEESFSYIVYDSKGASSTSEVIVSIKGTNDSPTIEPLEVSVKEDDLTYISGSLNPILDPDNELDGIISENTYYLAIENTNGMYGNFTLSEDGTYTYTLNNNLDIVQNLNEGEYLTEIFSYVVYDENGGQTTSTITIKIEGKNEGSCGGDDNGSAEHVQLHVVEDTINSASGKLSSLEVGEKYTASVITNEYGTLTINEDGTIYFVLDNDSPFVDGLNDGDKVISNFTFYNGEKTGTISVIIEGTSDAKEVINTIEIQEDAGDKFTGTLNTAENIYNPSTYAEQEIEGEYGTFYLSANGSYYYLLDSDKIQYLGEGEKISEVFSYTVTDSNGQSTTEELTFNITGTNDNPTALVSKNTIEEDTNSLSGKVDAYDVDDIDTISIRLDDSNIGQYGTITLNADGTYTYVLDNTNALVQGLGEGESLTDSFIYTVTDSNGAKSSSTIEITINGKNDQSQVNELVQNSVTEDEIMIANGTLPIPKDADTNDTITFVPIYNDACTYGSIFITAGGSYVYTLDGENPLIQALGKGESLVETITYTTVDSAGVSQEHSLEITINGTNDLPFISKQEDSIEADTTSITGTLEASDVDNDVLTYSLAGADQGVYGKLVLNADGSYVYTLNTEDSTIKALAVGDRLVEIFEVRVDDGNGGQTTNYFEIVIDGTNDAPILEAQELYINEGEDSIEGYLQKPTDIDNNDSAEYIAQSDVKTEYGTITIYANGKYIYTLDNSNEKVQNLEEGENLQDTILIYAQDKEGAISESSLTITIEGTTSLTDMETEEMIEEDEVEFYIFSADESITQIAGSLVDVEDIDSEKAHYVAQENTQTEYGLFNLAEDGQYTYIIDNINPKITDLNIGEKIQDEIIIQAIDDTGNISESTFTMNIEGTSDSPSGYSDDYKDLIGDYNLGGVLTSSHENLEDFFDITESNSNEKTDYSHVIDYSASDTSLNTEATIQSEIMKMG